MAICCAADERGVLIKTEKTRKDKKGKFMGKYRVAQKIAPLLYALTLPNINRFSTLFYCQNQEKICDNTIAKVPTILQVYRYTTL